MLKYKRFRALYPDWNGNDWSTQKYFRMARMGMRNERVNKIIVTMIRMKRQYNWVQWQGRTYKRYKAIKMGRI